jgi:hypothetical protein
MIFSKKKHVVAILSGIFLLYFIALFLSLHYKGEYFSRQEAVKLNVGIQYYDWLVNAGHPAVYAPYPPLFFYDFEHGVLLPGKI